MGAFALAVNRAARATVLRGWEAWNHNFALRPINKYATILAYTFLYKI
jgi:hypothetical protein